MAHNDTTNDTTIPEPLKSAIEAYDEQRRISGNIIDAAYKHLNEVRAEEEAKINAAQEAMFKAAEEAYQQ